MRLKTIGGRLTLGSVFRLVAVGWLISGGLLALAYLLFVVVGVVTTGQVAFNGLVVLGAGQALLTMAPVFVMFPLIVIGQALALGGLVTLGVWLYQRRRPLVVTAAEPGAES